jgi:arylsulfatase A-like enzyme
LLAEAGVLFEDVTAPAPWTWPSHASLFTGEPPWVHGARAAADPGEDPVARKSFDSFHLAADRLRDDLPTLAERFAAGGYRTAALVANDWLDPELGLLRGFEHARLFESDAELIDAATAVIAADDGRPVFLFLNVMSAHAPYREGPGAWALGDDAFLDPERAPDWVRPYLTEAGDGPPGVFLSRTPPGSETNAEIEAAAGRLTLPDADLDRVARLYEASVRAADYVLTRVIEPWIAAHPDGVVAVTSDHGEALGERGRLGHLASVYREVLQVPLVIAAPGRLPAARRVAAAVAMRDLHPTLLELAGLARGGRSLVALARGEPGASVDPTVSAASEVIPSYALLAGARFDRDLRLRRSGGFGLVWSRDDPSLGELYDLTRDPGMRTDLAAAEPARVAELAAAARSELARDGDSLRRPVEIPEAVAERLRSLGYAAP